MAVAQDPLLLARRLALGVPVLLLAGAYLSQYGFGLYPCELCWWQRYGHFAAIPLAALAFLAPPQRLWLLLAAFAILSSGLVGGFHAGVEYGWWEGLTTCSNPIGDVAGDPLQAIMDAPLIRCDEVQWSFMGISLAGFNFLISSGAALVMLVLVAKGGRDD